MTTNIKDVFAFLEQQITVKPNAQRSMRLGLREGFSVYIGNERVFWSLTKDSAAQMQQLLVRTIAALFAELLK